jgi:3-oxoacyl-[acyl-carrier-protein] synthase-3
MYALRLASSLVNDGLSNVVVVASEVYSKILNPNDLSTFPYFGDGAAACLVSRHGRYELADFVLHSDGCGCDVIQVPGGGTMLPSAKVEDERDFYFRMIGRKVFEFATLRAPEVLAELSSRNNVEPDCVVLHQANVNIIREIAQRSGWSFNKFFVNVDRYANTAGASVLIGLDEVLESDTQPNNIMLCAFGGGLSWGGALLRLSAS